MGYTKFKLDPDKLDEKPKQVKTMTRNVESKPSRNKTGCFCCRKRRIKCFGSKPSCLNCIKSSYLCVWPNGKESLSHNTDFQLVKVKRLANKNIKFIPIEQRATKIGKSVLKSSNIQTTKSSVQITEHENMSNEEVNETNTENQISSGILLNEQILLNYNGSEFLQDLLMQRFFIQLNCSMTDKVLVKTWDQSFLLYENFINGFLTDISPKQYNVKVPKFFEFLPEGMDNSIMCGLFASCGTHFVYSLTKNVEMKLLAQDQHYKALNELLKYLSSSHNLLGKESWVVLFLIISFIKIMVEKMDRHSQSLNMIAIIGVVKLWIANKQNISLIVPKNEKKSEIDSKDNDFIPLADDFVIQRMGKRVAPLISLSNTFETLNNTITQTLEKANVNDVKLLENSNNVLDPSKFIIFRYERTVLESFVYHYCNSIFLTETSLLDKFCSPYTLFDILRPYFSCSIYDSSKPWINTSIAETILANLELQAKACWLILKKPLTTESKELLEQIKTKAGSFIKLSIPLQVYENESKEATRKLMESCYAAEIISKAVFVYTTKILNPGIDINDDIIQNAVEEAYHALTKITIQSQIYIILTFSLIIIGSVATNTQHREYILKKIRKLKEIFKSHLFDLIEKVCEFSWENSHIYYQENNWELLFDFLKIM